MNPNLEIQVQNLDHLGLVAGVIEEIGIVEIINEIVPEKAGEKVSSGQAVKAMILNGIGLFSSPLYLFSKFFEGKATEHLIGVGIQPEHLNDDRLGRVLDKLDLAGSGQIFTAVALAAVKKFNVDTQTVHLDSSSFHVHGAYLPKMPEVYFTTTPDGEDSVGQASPLPISITYGYSRDHRPDLKQFMLDIICSGDGDVPLLLRAADGNSADSSVFAQILCEFKKQFEVEGLMVADSALYRDKNLKLLGDLKWLSRTPLTIKQAKQLISQLMESDFIESQIPGYRWSEHPSNYGGIEQRWLVVESDIRRQSDRRQLEKKVEKAAQEGQKKLRELSAQKFACGPDALVAAQTLSKQLNYHNLTDIKIEHSSEKNRKLSQKDPKEFYTIQASLAIDSNLIERETRQAGRFILATNVLDVNELSNAQMIAKYKEQQSAERGFAFLKDPLFFTDSVFLKSPERIEALCLIMGLCLLVYTLAQRYLRQALQQAKSGLKNQLGKRTERPTLRWIFQCFQAVHLLTINSVKKIGNLTDERLEILRFFPERARAYYLLL